MTLRNIPFVAVTAIVVIAAGSLTVPTTSHAGTGAKVFSSKFLNKYCRKAQKKIAKTKLKAENVLFEDLGTPGIPFPPPGVPATGFIGSDALPYDGAEELPLTTTQYVGFGTDNWGDEYAQVVMCKMKSAEALDFYFPGEATSGNDCSNVNRKIVRKVIKALDNDDDSDSGDGDWGDSDSDHDGGITVPDIIYDNWLTYTGQQWTDSSPAPVAFYSSADGHLHIVGKELFVARTNPSPFVGPEKKGVDYCQTIAPEYVKKILLGDVTPPTCDPFPEYSPPVGGPPQGPLPWNCQNP